MIFNGRVSELRRLEKELMVDDTRMVLVYGRCRVGKSALIKQALYKYAMEMK